MHADVFFHSSRRRGTDMDILTALLLFFISCVLGVQASDTSMNEDNETNISSTSTLVPTIAVDTSSFSTINMTYYHQTTTSPAISENTEEPRSLFQENRLVIITACSVIIIFTLIALLILGLWITIRVRKKKTGSLQTLEFPLSSDGSDLPLAAINKQQESPIRTGAVDIENFSNHVQQMHQESDRGFEEEFDALSKGHPDTYDIAKFPVNIDKNRFENIFPYDNSRVILKATDSEGCSDYINASYIDGYNRENSYIAAQGPLRNTICDFWQMVWQYKLRTIIMLTETVEAGRAFEHAGVGIHVVGSGSCHAFVRYPTVNTTYLTLIKGHTPQKHKTIQVPKSSFLVSVSTPVTSYYIFPVEVSTLGIDCPVCRSCSQLNQSPSTEDKCEQYWPALLNKEWSVGCNLSVTLDEQKQYAEYRVKVLTLNKTSETEAEPLVVVHYHFSAWPDHGVPADKSCLIHFIKRVRKNHPYYNTPPLVVHCSAGVGRSGTFIVLDSMIQQMNENVETIDIYNFVCCMRKKRPLMVQTEAQYAFIHDALDEYITCGDTSIAVTNMRITLGKLSKQEDTESGFEQQFELLRDVSSKGQSRMYSREGAKDYNASKNRSQDILPYDLTRVYLKSTGARGSDYINANYVDGYKHRKAFIATQGPMKSTVNDFWRMIWEHKSRVLVMLCDLTEDGKECSCQYWPTAVDSSEVYGRLKVKYTSEENHEDFTVRKFQIGEDTPYLIPGVPDGVNITQLHHTDWKCGESSPTTSSVLKLIDFLIKTQMGTGNSAITVLCSDGIGRTGTFICIYSQLERLKAEGIVDVFQSIKASRLQRPLMVSSTDQFAFCHQVLADYLDTFDNYANFKDLQ